MEVTIMIHRNFEKDFRSCVSEFNSMAIVDRIPSRGFACYIYMIVEDTNETDTFLEDLFKLGQLFEKMTNLPY